MRRSKLETLLKENNQEHLLAYYDKLSEEKQNLLMSQIEQVDWKLIQLPFQKKSHEDSGIYEPIKGMSIEDIKANHRYYYDLGMRAINEGAVAAVLLAGGQGTRLGCNGPKGTVDIGLTKEVYIFELNLKSLLEVAKEAQTWIPLYIMTSHKNNEETVDFFKQHNFFGYPEEYITFFKQDMAPSVSFDGKLLMEAPDRLSLSPNGNGGWFSSMIKAGLLNDLHRRNIQWINVFSVDNVLQKIADPVFIGATIATNHLCAAKVVRKEKPEERVGVLCSKDGRPSIIEYYEMTEDMLYAQNSDGSLSYAYGVILNYLFRLDKLEEVGKHQLPIHIAEKKIPYYTAEKGYITPNKPNGYKFEELALDLVTLFDNCLPFEVIRENEFAPIKNAHGDDSIDTARQLLRKQGIVL